MKAGMKALAGALVLLSTTSISGIAEAGYFIRPYVQLGAGVVDGVDVNGATAGSAHFTTSHQSNVDLRTGTVKAFLEINGPDAGGSGFGQSTGIFGDRLTFHGGDGTDATFSFTFDGTVQSPARDPIFNSTLQIGVSAFLYVYDASAGATYQNFTSLGGALVAKSDYLEFRDPATALNEAISRVLSDTVLLDEGITTLDVFAGLSIFTSVNANPVTVTMDFLNTGTFGIETAPGVTFTSDSGVFLTPAAERIPEPATLALCAIGLAGLWLGSRARKTHAA